MLASGQVVDRYVVEGPLGTGAMAVVYRVRHQVLGSVHALKVLAHPQLGVTPQLLREGKIQAGLRHPNLVAVTDVVPLGEHVGLVLEYVEGPTLEALLRERGRLPFAEAEGLFRGVLAGVEHAHRAGFVHRDLKPANILLAPTAHGWVPKVADFGLARDGGAANRSGEGLAIGTPLYMAPEQVRAEPGVGTRADLFALGSVLYEMLAGKPAFGAGDAFAVMKAVAIGTRPDLRTLVPDAPAHLVAVVDACHVVDVERRVQDCAGVRALLDARRPVRAPIGALIGLAAAALLGVTGLLVALASMSPTPAAPVAVPAAVEVAVAVQEAAPVRVGKAPAPSPRRPVEPAVAPVVAPMVAPVVANDGAIELVPSAEVRSLTLVGEDGARRPPGPVPAGAWLLEATFADGTPVQAGRVRVGPGERVRVRCAQAFQACSRAP